MKRIFRIVLLAGLSSLALGISAAHADEHQTAPLALPAAWNGTGDGNHNGYGERGDDHRDERSDARIERSRWGDRQHRREERRREALRREAQRREWQRRQRSDRDGDGR